MENYRVLFINYLLKLRVSSAALRKIWLSDSENCDNILDRNLEFLLLIFVFRVSLVVIFRVFILFVFFLLFILFIS